MKIWIYLILSGFVIYSLTSCSGCGAGKEAETEDTMVVWMTSYDLPIAEVNLYKKIIRRDTSVDIERLQLDSVIKGLNWRYENTGLEKLRQNGDTVFVSLNNSKYLSRGMGTMGAEEYIADVVANLTTVTGVNFVDFIFPEGIHATPGTYGKEVLDDLREIK